MAEWNDAEAVLLTKGTEWGYRVLNDTDVVLSWAGLVRHEVSLPAGHNWFPNIQISHSTSDGFRIFAVIGTINEIPNLEYCLRAVAKSGYGRIVLDGHELQLSHFVPYQGLTRQEVIAPIEAIHDMSAFLKYSVMVSLKGDPANGTGRTLAKNQKNVVIALVIVAIFAVVVAIGAGISKSQDKSYSDGFEFGYAIRGSGNAQGQCKYMWNHEGQSSDNQSLWISGCAAGVNS